MKTILLRQHTPQAVFLLIACAPTVHTYIPAVYLRWVKHFRFRTFKFDSTKTGLDCGDYKQRFGFRVEGFFTFFWWGESYCFGASGSHQCEYFPSWSSRSRRTGSRHFAGHRRPNPHISRPLNSTSQIP